ncbi:DNA polymerase III, delta prime subunit [Thermodesulfatator indicus DSM 15286]|uniref:DNA polymerase III, delta prime subunit n=1 Tax=Thermodesulfatator indicus (strain DSM 15286 / JCM 11887 / CIR29812) TaxID=667014 RepID=F8ABF7_THEID|nr:DNA polymerase III subunit delta' [Thermodesulfatator indicus]AEH44468.1 DNA polymerase III, delta prime subunit [Thermodesulfatator indicus DSM 15286]
MSALEAKILSFSEIKGQEKALAILKQAQEENRLPHAYLFLGPEGVGRETTALSLFRRLLCVKQSGCGECVPCKKFERGNHPDVEIIQPQGKSIKIEQIRELEAKLYFRPLEAERRFILFTDAEAMTREAANALLKSLEEPPAYTLFVLIAKSTEGLLPTIVSRCQVLRFRPIPKDTLKELLVKRLGITSEEAEGLAILAEGSVARALRLAEKGYLEELARLVKAIATGKPHLIVSVAEVLPKLGEDLPLFWELVLVWLRQALVNELGLDEFPALFPEKPPRDFIIPALEKIEKAFLALQMNLNQELFLLELLTNLSKLWRETSQAEVASMSTGAA